MTARRIFVLIIFFGWTLALLEPFSQTKWILYAISAILFIGTTTVFFAILTGFLEVSE